MTFLTPDELRELTDCKRPGDQIRWLRERRWRFEVSATGRPRVADDAQRAECDVRAREGWKEIKKVA